MGLTEVLLPKRSAEDASLFSEGVGSTNSPTPLRPGSPRDTCDPALAPHTGGSPLHKSLTANKAPGQHLRQLKDSQTTSQLRALVPAFDISCAPCETRARAGAPRTLPRPVTGSPLEVALLGGPARDGGSSARNPGRRPRSSRPRSAAPGARWSASGRGALIRPRPGRPGGLRSARSAAGRPRRTRRSCPRSGRGRGRRGRRRAGRCRRR